MRKKELLNADRLWEYALKSAGLRAQSTSEMRSKLRQRAASSADVESILERLKEYRFLDDTRFAETFAIARLENRGLGKQRVLRDLAQRRIGSSVAGPVVDQVYEQQDEAKLIEAFIRRKYRNASRETLFQKDKDLAAAFRRLRLAGFSSGNAIKVLKQFAANPERLDEVDLDAAVQED